MGGSSPLVRRGCQRRTAAVPARVEVDLVVAVVVGDDTEPPRPATIGGTTYIGLAATVGMIRITRVDSARLLP